MASVKSTRTGVKLLITRKFTEFANKKFSPEKMKFAARQVANEEIDLIRKRTIKGLDKDGRKFRPLSARYLKMKPALMKAVKASNRTAFAATSARQILRLSGRMLRDMSVRNLRATRSPNGTIAAMYTIVFRTAYARELADYHNESGAGKKKIFRRFLGHAKTPNEKKLLTSALRRGLK